METIEYWKKRAEAAEAKLAELAKQVYPKAVVKHYTGCEYPVIKLNSIEVVIAGEREDAEELAEYINSMRPAPAAVPAYLVPDEMYPDHPKMRWVGIDELFPRIEGWNACRAEVLRRIEETN